MSNYQGIDEGLINKELETLEAVDVTIISSISDVASDVSTIEGDVATIEGDVSTIEGDVSTLQGDVALKLNSAAIFVSAVETGTGAPQNVAHGLGVIPSKVIVSIQTSAAGVSIVEGAHDATNVIVTVTSGDTFKVLAIA